jgi:hypothetical protein
MFTAEKYPYLAALREGLYAEITRRMSGPQLEVLIQSIQRASAAKPLPDRNAYIGAVRMITQFMGFNLDSHRADALLHKIGGFPEIEPEELDEYEAALIEDARIAAILAASTKDRVSLLDDAMKEAWPYYYAARVAALAKFREVYHEADWFIDRSTQFVREHLAEFPDRRELLPVFVANMENLGMEPNYLTADAIACEIGYPHEWGNIAEHEEIAKGDHMLLN